MERVEEKTPKSCLPAVNFYALTVEFRGELHRISGIGGNPDPIYAKTANLRHDGLVNTEIFLGNDANLG